MMPMISFRHFSAAPSSSSSSLSTLKSSRIFLAKLFLGFCLVSQITTTAFGGDEAQPTLASIRRSLIRQEDTIVFGLIERAQYPTNSPLYNQTSSRFRGKLFEYFVKRSEALQSKVGRYLSPEEVPFFPDDLPRPLLEPKSHWIERFLHPNTVNVSHEIWDVYQGKLLPLLAKKGDDGNYAVTASSDLQLLQALSRRIHCGKIVAEAKFRENPDKYKTAIRGQDRLQRDTHPERSYNGTLIWSDTTTGH
ncbi:PREDICTED: chorismate mutase 2-like isoform X2 [Ipomoea nil]|uniref:chorismate mutase 2-like isoform X2 n=1 Tax=Ipomoea nil TaxID=35883 RepID=UPI000901E86B|nr:PREDICTED: chorismate mutase 2-like isoform X2 [Ipomoea nil]